MSIWFNSPTIEKIENMFSHEHMGTLLDLKFTEIGPDFVKGTMPVDDRTKQPFGLLHGGASCVLSESLGSVASALCIDLSKNSAVGIEINACHLRSVTEGVVTGICRPVNIGRTLHVWQTDIYDDKDRHICHSKLTVAIIDKK